MAFRQTAIAAGFTVRHGMCRVAASPFRASGSAGTPSVPQIPNRYGNDPVWFSRDAPARQQVR